MELGLKEKVAIVTGGARGIGGSIVEGFAREGASLIIGDILYEAAQELAEKLTQSGARAIAVKTDVTKKSDADNLASTAIKEFGKIDILVNAADLRFARPFQEMTEDEWKAVMDANLNSVFHCCQAVGKYMLPQKKGRVISIISGLAERGLANSAAYSVSMGGVLQLTRALALEWAQEGVTVNAIGTGWFAEKDRIGALDEDRLLRYLPLKRYGHPREIGSLVVYLASDATDFVTGQFMYVDGGLMAHA